MSAAATVVTLRPGAPGTKRLTAQYGERLICVRYRYDAANHRRRKTVEIVVEETGWESGRKNRKQTSRDPKDLVRLRIGYQERDLQQRIRQAGGQWRPSRKVWEIAHELALALGLANRIVK
jgi:hypothetical protein